jgi:tricorn protease
VEVENMPHASFKGQDQQLETALKMLLEKIRSNPVEPHKSGPIDPVGAR